MYFGRTSRTSSTNRRHVELFSGTGNDTLASMPRWRNVLEFITGVPRGTKRRQRWNIGRRWRENISGKLSRLSLELFAVLQSSFCCSLLRRQSKFHEFWNLLRNSLRFRRKSCHQIISLGTSSHCLTFFGVHSMNGWVYIDHRTATNEQRSPTIRADIYWPVSVGAVFTLKSSDGNLRVSFERDYVW